ncbi:hypothetical protein C8A00DRAFT_38426, partial [Chaetomidium leptoderma]
MSVTSDRRAPRGISEGNTPWYAGAKCFPCPPGTTPYSGTGLAAISRNPSAPEVFVFFQCADANIYMASFNGTAWSLGPALFKAKLGTDISAVVRPGENAIQVFCADPDGVLTKLKGEPNPWTVTTGDKSKKLLDGSPIAGRVYKRKADGKHMVDIFAVYAANRTSRG